MKMRKALILPIIASLLLGVVMIGLVGAQSTTLGVEPVSIVDEGLVPGSTFTVGIWVHDVANLAGVEFKLGYNTLVLTATSVVYGGVFGPTYFEMMNAIYDDAGYLHYSVIEFFGEPGFTGAAALVATINFTVDAVGESPLSLFETKLGDVGANPISHTTIDGYFRNTLEELVYSATLARRRAWPEHHDFYLGKDEDFRNDLFAIVCNDGTGGTMIKVVFAVTDSAGVPLGDWETDTIPLMAGEMVGDTKANRYKALFPTPFPQIPPELGKYYVSAECWVDTDLDGVPDTPMGLTRSFSFNVLPETE